MNKLLKAALITAGALAATAAVAAILSAPGRATPEEKEKLYGRSVAHRGLHGENGDPPENSLAAFRAAREAGYGSELDARLTGDGELAVLHDKSTWRMCGIDKCVEDTPMAELKELHLGSSEETIPTLAEALQELEGSEVVILELKSAGPRNEELCEKALAAIRDFHGPLCVESFDPRILCWFRQNAPDILRGQLTDSFSHMKDDTHPLNALFISQGLSNVLARPQFIAHGSGRKGPLIYLAEKLGALSVAWTVQDDVAQLSNDAIIFEHFLPMPVYK